MRAFPLTLLSLAAIATAQNCGPKYNNAVCAAEKCCSQYGWCDTDAPHCDPKTCLKPFSGRDSPCASSPTTTLKTTTKPPPTAAPYASHVPVIDVCGHAQGGVSCPGAGASGYFYRCCSSAGHCGPKNDIQEQALYCGAGCQAGFGKCDAQRVPGVSAGDQGISGEGETCGPIVGRRCGGGLCCSGSNFCGRGEEFCGEANWCQGGWGECA